MNLLNLVKEQFRAPLQEIAPDPLPYVAMIRATQDPKHGDYQANFAMSLAKLQGKKPREIAEQIKAKLPASDVMASPEIAGPGFVNIQLSDDWLARQVQAMAADDRLGVEKTASPRTFVVDFSSPNVAKPMHVGHLRSTIIGDALARLLRFLGHEVVTDNHLGDWGTQFGILLYGYRHLLDQKAFDADPVRELARLYVEVRRRMKPEGEEKGVDPIAEAARLETAKLHAGDTGNLRLWKMFMPFCLEEINRVYRRLDVHFDRTLGESFYNEALPGIVTDLVAKRIAEPSEGAIAIFFGENETPALIQKRDGAFTYTTTDLATIKYRIDTWKPSAILYVVDSRQALHFKNLFDAVRRWGYGDVELEHIAFGSVLGDNRRPLKTRAGDVPELEGLLDEAVGRAGETYEQLRQESIERGDEVLDLSAEERKQIEEAVGIGAVKYADLCQNRVTDYIFSWPKMLAMTGNTAAYMQYAYARNRSILRKAEVDSESLRAKSARIIVGSAYERALVIQLLRLQETLELAAAEYQPSSITAYLWDLSKCFSGFFQNCPVLRAEAAEVKQSRLTLCDLTARVIQLCLGLLGIRTVERM